MKWWVRTYGLVRAKLIFPNAVAMAGAVYKIGIIGRLALHGSRVLDKIIDWDARRQ